MNDGLLRVGFHRSPPAVAGQEQSLDLGAQFVDNATAEDVEIGDMEKIESFCCRSESTSRLRTVSQE
ncbi:hypothetical protein BW685_31170 [Burkholderia ubonensis]|uniref:Uncharacterized protein n=1 Tax=Burkholderia ubonensis TaxID=101571 RepID=A0A1R1J294_9BURK|nr:hypothetical protein BW685_31170 [Burkholderia ubonensis]